LKGFLIKDPESVFYWQRLVYYGEEMGKIIDRFDQAADARAVHQQVKSLMNAARDFHHSTVPIGLFANLRNQTKTPAELAEIFLVMESALKAANLSAQDFDEQDQKIFSLALDYVKKSILQQMDELPEKDPLKALWDQSDLRRELVK